MSSPILYFEYLLKILKLVKKVFINPDLKINDKL